MQTTPSERAAHVALWRESGLSKAAYCRESGISYQTFVSWTRTLGSDAGEASDDQGPIEFVELVDDRRPEETAAAALCVQVDSLALNFAASAPAAWVAAVLRAVRAC